MGRGRIRPGRLRRQYHRTTPQSSVLLKMLEGRAKHRDALGKLVARKMLFTLEVLYALLLPLLQLLALLFQVLF